MNEEIKNCRSCDVFFEGLFCLTHLRELLSKLVQFLLQRGLLLLCGGHLVTNLTDLSGDASRNSNTSGFPRGDIGALSFKTGGNPIGKLADQSG